MPDGSRPPEIATLIDDVMRTMAPYRCGYVGVKADSLLRLCEAAGRDYSQHWVLRVPEPSPVRSLDD